MRKIALAIVVVVAASMTVAGTVAVAKDGHGHGGTRGQFGAGLVSYQEVPAKSTTGHGRLQVRVQGDVIHYVLTFADLETDSLFAHIHFGQVGVNGGVSAFLCGGGDKPTCPLRGGTVEGDIDAADVVGPNDQGIEPGSMPELQHAIAAGVAYANVHTQQFPAGEIRGQIRHGHAGPPPRRR